MSIRVRKLQSGRPSYEVRLRAPDGRQYTKSFRTRKDAEDYISRERAGQLAGTWIDPSAGRVLLEEFAAKWVELRPALRPRTLEHYDLLLGRYILPELGRKPLDKLTPMLIRSWHARLATVHGASAIMSAKAYRLLRSILTTAVDDEVISRNPCLLRGAGVERSAERPVLSMAQVTELADAIDPRYRSMVLLATWAGLRFGESAALRRSDVDLRAGTIRIERQVQELKNGKRIEGPPKTHAGRRVISLPPHIEADLDGHLATLVGPESDAPVFTMPEGSPLRRSNWNRRFWQPACRKAGIVGVRFHDLRHTGNTFAASTGASTKELMARMGHSSARAALIYQHATRERDRALAEALSKLVETSATETGLRQAVEGEGRQETDGDRLGWWKFGGSSIDSGLGEGPKKVKTPDQIGWRRWDSNPRPPACKAGALAS